MSLPQDHL